MRCFPGHLKNLNAQIKSGEVIINTNFHSRGSDKLFGIKLADELLEFMLSNGIHVEYTDDIDMKLQKISDLKRTVIRSSN